MSDVTTPPLGGAGAPAPVPPAPAPAATGTGNLPGLLALIFGIVGFVLGVIPPTAAFAWILLVPAIVLGIVGLALKGRRKGLALAGLIIGIVGLIVAIIVATVTILSAVGTAVSSRGLDAPTAGSTADSGSTAAPAPGKKEAKIGDTVTNRDGVAFTVGGVQCGIPSAGDSFMAQQAKGQFCEVKFTIKNGGSKEITLLSNDITGFIGTNEYDVEGSVSTFGGDPFSTSVNPGLSADCDVFIDIPTGQALDYVQFKPAFSFADAVTVAAK